MCYYSVISRQVTGNVRCQENHIKPRTRKHQEVLTLGRKEDSNAVVFERVSHMGAKKEKKSDSDYFWGEEREGELIREVSLYFPLDAEVACEGFGGPGQMIPRPNPSS